MVFNITGIPYYEPISLGLKAVLVLLLAVRVYQEERRFKIERIKQ